MRITFITSLIICTFLFYSCAQKKEMLAAEDSAAAVTSPDVPSVDLYSNGSTKLIKTAHYRFQATNVKESTDAIEAAIRKYPAYISASDTKLDNPILENKMTIRVQNEFFQDLLKEIDQQAQYVNFRNVSTEDVAKQFVDLESRLSTKREVEKRYAEILRSKVGTIKELLDAEKQIGELHTDIEATISRINYLREEVQYSTIQLEFYQTISTTFAEVDKVTATRRLLDGFVAGWMGLVDIAIAAAYLWPLILIISTFTFIYFNRRKKKFKLAQ